MLSYGVFVWPELRGQGLIDESHTGRTFLVVLGKVASTQDRNLEQAQVPWRDAHPFASAAVLLHRAANNLERHGIFNIDWQPVSSGSQFYTWKGIQPFAAIPHKLNNACRRLVALAVE